MLQGNLELAVTTFSVNIKSCLIQILLLSADLPKNAACSQHVDMITGGGHNRVSIGSEW